MASRPSAFKSLIRVAAAYLAVGAILRPLVYLVLPIPQCVMDGDLDFDWGLLVALPVYFVIFRLWVGVLVGAALAVSFRLGRKGPFLVSVGTLLPLLCEALALLGLVSEWLDMGSAGLRVALDYLTTPLLAGFLVSVWFLRRPASFAAVHPA